GWAAVGDGESAGHTGRAFGLAVQSVVGEAVSIGASSGSNESGD
ncbi:phosphotransferase system, partial [Cutibacterium acnes]